MDPGFLVNGVLRSVLGGRRKRSRNALRYLTGGRGSFLSNPATLLTAAGVAWGIYETMNDRGGAARAPAVDAPRSPEPAAAVPPPLPGTRTPDDDAIRLIRLAISAAHADGTLNERERAAVLEQATAAGVSAVVERELAHPVPIREIVSGVSDPAERATLYVLAFTILKADEQITGAERIYLAQLAHLLGLDPEAVQRLEQDAGERIEALGDQGQPGG